ncbi:MAG: hypothetical protein ACXVBV_19385, partial [Isosphaeraceae bacterium]
MLPSPSSAPREGGETARARGRWAPNGVFPGRSRLDRRVHRPFPQLPQQLVLERAAEILGAPRRTHR